MLSTIARLFGKSPFAPLQTHMKKVSACIKMLTKIFESIEKGDFSKLEENAKALSKLEHEADLTKNDIRNHLPKSIFLPIDRPQFLEILSLQDSIADKAEEIGFLLSFSSMKKRTDLYKNLNALFVKNMQAFWDVRNILKELDELLESSFGGIEAEKVKVMVEKTSYKEYEADKLKISLLKDFFETGNDVPNTVFYLYTKLIEEINQISHISERLAHRIRMVLELK